VATASSQESSAYPGSLTVDGDATTSWSSAFSDPQTLELSGPVYLGNGASTLASPVAIAFSKASWSAPVTNDPVTFTLATTHP
jgi:hypothetical protein